MKAKSITATTSRTVIAAVLAARIRLSFRCGRCRAGHASEGGPWRRRASPRHLGRRHGRARREAVMRRILVLVLLFALAPLGTIDGTYGENPGSKSAAGLARQHIENEATGDSSPAAIHDPRSGEKRSNAFPRFAGRRREFTSQSTRHSQQEECHDSSLVSSLLHSGRLSRDHRGDRPRIEWCSQERRLVRRRTQQGRTCNRQRSYRVVRPCSLARPARCLPCDARRPADRRRSGSSSRSQSAHLRSPDRRRWRGLSPPCRRPTSSRFSSIGRWARSSSSYGPLGCCPDLCLAGRCRRCGGWPRGAVRRDDICAKSL